MTCAWKELIAILPEWMRREVDRQGIGTLQELRLRLGKPPAPVGCAFAAAFDRAVTRDDLNFCINTASRYSPWAAESVRNGYLTTAGGHRIGICGQAAVQNGHIQGIRSVTSLCIRVAREFPGISSDLWEKQGSILIIGSPGAGKTTLLRDLIRQLSLNRQGSVAVVDQRGELFPPDAVFDTGPKTDILTGCDKENGIDMVLRCMGPSVIAVDEITAAADAEVLLRAVGCGVALLATAHAASVSDLKARPVYRRLLEYGLFDWLVILQPDKTWSVERMVK